MADSSFLLNRNPLGIYSRDGSELKLSTIARNSITPTDFDEDEYLSKAMKAEFSYHHPSDSVPTGEIDLADLNISHGEIEVPTGPLEGSILQDHLSISQAQPDHAYTPSAESMKPLELDLGGKLIINSLERKPTITARPVHTSESSKYLPDLSTKTGPSANPLLIERLRSIRRRMGPKDRLVPIEAEEEVQIEEGLNDDVLKMIAFSAGSPWLEMKEFPEPDMILDQGNVSEDSATRDFDGVDVVKNGNLSALNPFDSVNKPVTVDSPSVLTLASKVSTQSLQGTEAASYPSSRSDTPDFEPEVVHNEKPVPVVARTPTLEETDPVSQDDRGRLFLQINKISNMRGIPIDSGRHPKFTLSLDNGLQTVTTDPSPLPALGLGGQISAKIGQEFELVVAKDLELILTVALSMDALQPPSKPTAPRRRIQHETQKSTSSVGSMGSASTPATSHSPIKNMKNLLLRSPKKKVQQQQQRRFQEQEEEEQRQLKLQQDEEDRQRRQHERDMKDFHTRSDLWRGLTGPQGEYCRGYVFESHYEKEIYGKSKSFSVPLYNEWDKSTNGVPRSVGELQVTMMYVPKLFASEQIPMSMRECVDAIDIAKNTRPKGCQGFLTQTGGDCGSMWKRRWFTLQGTEMTSHHEATRKKRSLIHLEEAVAVKDTLSDDMWCIYEDKSFQITFRDGERIGFYADSVEARDLWIQELKDGIANGTGQHRSWVDLVVQPQE